MSAPKTLRGFEKLFAAEIRAARDTYSAVLERPAETRAERIARYRDLIAAETTLADLYRRATEVVPLPPSGDPADSIVFHALSVTARCYREDARGTQRTLDVLLAEDGNR